MTLHVLYVSETDGPHDRRFRALIEARDGVEVTYVVAPPLSPGLAKPKVRAANKSGLLLIEASAPAEVISALAHVIDSVQPDVVHAGPVPTTGYYAAKADSPGLVVMSWGRDLLWDIYQDDELYAQTADALRASRAFIADCATARATGISLGADPNRTVVFPWGVDLSVFRPRPSGKWVRNHIGVPHDALVFFTNRSWEPIYRVDLVIKAFEHVAKHDPSAWLVVAGDGPEEDTLHPLIAASPARDRIVTTGRLGEDELVNHLRASDVYVSAARIDGSSVSLLEAMACGVAPIVTNHEANREWISAGQSGWLFERDDVTSLRDQMVLAARSQDERVRYGRAARATAEARADWVQNRTRLFDAYEKAML